MTADGKLLASGGEEGIVRLYDTGNGKLLKTIRSEPGPKGR
jgi:hypothetical protein